MRKLTKSMMSLILTHKIHIFSKEKYTFVLHKYVI